jgi:hypothetical protein
MPLQNKTIKGIDLPVYEFLRPHPITGGTAANQHFVGSHDGKDQFMFGARSGIAYRYDIYADNWLTLPNPPQTNDSRNAMAMNTRGYTGQVISATLSSVFIATANGTANIIGNRIKIINGPGKNQERIIKSVSAPIVDAYMVVTAATNNAAANAGTINVTDSSLALNVNQYKGWEIKFVGNATGYNQVRTILYNTSTVFQLADPALFGVHPQCCPGGLTTPATNQIGAIQCSEVVLESNWDELPTNDSLFEIVDSNKVYLFTNTNNPFSFHEFDRYTSVWYYRTVNPNRSGQFATDWTLETTFLAETPSVSSTITSATTNTFTDTVCGTNVLLTNYVIKIVSGTGTGQVRNILSAGPVSYQVVPPWDIIPDSSSSYIIRNQDSSLYCIGNAEARLFRYDIDLDSWFNQSQVLDYGFVATLYATNTAISGYGGIPITTLANSGATATITTSRPHLLTGTPSLVVQGATSPQFNGTFTVTPVAANASQFTYTMGGTPASTTAANSNTTTVIFDLKKSWITNQFVGQLLMVHNGVQTNQTPGLAVRYITANTTNSITVNTTFGFTPANGSRYFIIPITAMGRDRTEGDAANKLSYGLCTSSGTTTLTDSTKSWKTNIHAGKRLLIVAGTSAGTEVGISTNTATVLTLAASVTTDTTSVYVIINNLVNAGGCNLKYASNTTSNKGRYIYYHRGGNAEMFGAKYDIPRETFELVNYFNPIQNTNTTNTGQCAVYDYGDRLYFNLGSNNREIFYVDLEKEFTYHGGLYPYGSSNSNYTAFRNMAIFNTEGVKFLYYVRGGNTGDWYRHMITF